MYIYIYILLLLSLSSRWHSRCGAAVCFLKSVLPAAVRLCRAILGFCNFLFSVQNRVPTNGAVHVRDLPASHIGSSKPLLQHLKLRKHLFSPYVATPKQQRVFAGDVLALEVSQNTKLASPCCVGIIFNCASHAAWGRQFRVLRHLCGENAPKSAFDDTSPAIMTELPF